MGFDINPWQWNNETSFGSAFGDAVKVIATRVDADALHLFKDYSHSCRLLSLCCISLKMQIIILDLTYMFPIPIVALDSTPQLLHCLVCEGPLCALLVWTAVQCSGCQGGVYTAGEGL